MEMYQLNLMNILIISFKLQWVEWKKEREVKRMEKTRPDKFLLGLTDRQHNGQNDLHQRWRHAYTQLAAVRTETGKWFRRCRRLFGDERWRKDGRTDSRPVSDCQCSSSISHDHRTAARYTSTRLQSPHAPAIQPSTTPATSTNEVPIRQRFLTRLHRQCGRGQWVPNVIP